MSGALEVIKKATPDPSPKDIDRYGDLCQKVDLFAPVLEEQKLLKERIEAGLTHKPGDLPTQVQGDRYELQLSARRNERTIIDVYKVFCLLRKRLGIKGLLSLITIPLVEAVDKHMTTTEQQIHVVKEQTGSRSIKVVPKRPAPAA